MQLEYMSPESVDWGAPINWAHPLNRGLVSWWLAVPNRMGWKTFTWRDLCRRNNAVLTSGQMWGTSTGRSGSFGSLSLSGDTGIVASALGPSSVTAALITAWIRPISLASYNGILETRTGGHLLGLLLSGAAGNPLTYTWEGLSDEYNAATGLSLTLNRWHFVSMSVTPTAATVYLYGPSGFQSWTNTKTHNAQTMAVEWNFGYDSATPGSREWDGQVDDLRVYSRAFSEREIIDLCRNSLAGYPDTLNRPSPRRYRVAATGWGHLLSNARNRLVNVG